MSSNFILEKILVFKKAKKNIQYELIYIYCMNFFPTSF